MSKRVYATPMGDAILLALADGPATTLMLSQLFGVAQSSINSALRVQKKLGTLRINSWERHAHGRITAVWALGGGKDAKQPKPYTTAERTRRYAQNNPITRNITRRKSRGQQPKIPVWLVGLMPQF